MRDMESELKDNSKDEHTHLEPPRPTTFIPARPLDDPKLDVPPTLAEATAGAERVGAGARTVAGIVAGGEALEISKSVLFKEYVIVNIPIGRLQRLGACFGYRDRHFRDCWKRLSDCYLGIQSDTRRHYDIHFLDYW